MSKRVGRFQFAVLTVCFLLVLTKLFALTGGAHTISLAGAGLGFMYLAAYDRARMRKLIANVLTAAVVASCLALAWQNADAFASYYRTVLYASYCAACYHIGAHASDRLPPAQFERLVVLLVLYGVCFNLMDLYFRFYEPGFALQSYWRTDQVYASRSWGFAEDNFHVFKMGSVMYFDSNYSAIYLFALLALVVFRYQNPKGLRLLLILVLSALTFLTFSRSVIVVACALLSANALGVLAATRRASRIRTAALLLLPPLIVGAGVYVLDTIATDVSGATKLEAISTVLAAIARGSSIAWFGEGFVPGWYTYSYQAGEFAHVQFAILIGQLGLLGAIAYLTTFVFMARGFRRGFATCCFLVIGLSLLDPWEGVIFCVVGLLGRTLRSANPVHAQQPVFALQ